MNSLALRAFKKLDPSKVSRLGKMTSVRVNSGNYVILPNNLHKKIVENNKLTRALLTRKTHNNKYSNNLRRLINYRPGKEKNNAIKNLQMKHGKLTPGTKQYNEVLRRYFMNMQNTLRPRSVRISARNPEIIVKKLFPTNKPGFMEFLAQHEYNNYVKKYKNAIRSTPYLKASKNKRNALINFLEKSNNINKAVKIFYQRAPRRRM